jgi:hypothetical protein
MVTGPLFGALEVRQLYQGFMILVFKNGTSGSDDTGCG